MNKNQILFFLIAIILFSCKNKENSPLDKTFIKEANWFKSVSNFEKDKTFPSKFYKSYRDLLKNDELEKAKLMLYNYGTVLSSLYWYDSTYVHETMNFIKKNDNVVKDSTYAILHYYIADLLVCDMKAKDAIPWAEKALKIDEAQLDDENINSIKYTLAYAYNATNQPQKALEQYLDNIKIAERNKNYYYVGHMYNGIAIIYTKFRLPKGASKNFEKAIINFKKSGKLEMYYLAQYEYLLNDFFLRKDTTKTLQSITPILDEFQTWKSPTDRTLCYINGLKFLKAFLTRDYVAAKKYNDISASYMPNTEANSYVFKLRDAQIYFEQNGRFKDEQKIMEFANLMIEEEDFNTAADLYYQLCEGERKKKNLEKALEYKKKENELREKVLAQNADGQIFEMEIKYETEKKEAQLVQQKSTILRNRLIIILLTLSLALLLTGFLIYNLLKKRKLTKIESQRQEQFTNQLMENTEEERSRIANELHDSVNHELLTIKNNLSNGKTINTEDISKVIEEVRNISRNLHPTILATIGFEASIENLCEKITESGLFTTCEIEYEFKLSKNKELQMYRIIQEALNNTLKHGKANAAKVILTSENNFLHLEIKDNGSGFNVQNELNSPKSFGLQSIFQRAKAILAKVSIDSNSKGTVILIKIPV